VVLIIDLISIFARSFFTEEGDLPKPTWLSVILPSGMIKNLK
jgi:hypothetical protein